MKLEDFENLDTDEKADIFVKATGIKVKKTYLKHDFYFINDTQCRDIYRVTISRDGKKFSFSFGQSVHNTRLGIKITDYDILSCIEKETFETFEDFCDAFGYDFDSMTAHKTFKKCNALGKKVINFFYQDYPNGDAKEIDYLRNIA